jgi:hypothetical protein
MTHHLGAIIAALGIVPAAAGHGSTVTLRPSGGDDSVQINRAIQSGARTIGLSAGTFQIAHPIVLDRADGLTIRGEGRGLTRLHSTICRPVHPQHPDYVKYSTILASGELRPSRLLLSCASEPCYRSGTRELSVADPDEFSVGDDIAIVTGNRTRAIDGPAELHKISGKRGGVLTLREPLVHDVDSMHWHVRGARAVRNVHLSDFTISGGAVAAIEMIATEGCTIERVEVRDFEGTVGINLDRAGRRNVVRDVSIGGEPRPDTWGISLESQDQSSVEAARVVIGSRDGQFGNAVSLNACTNVVVRDVIANGSPNGVLILSVGYTQPEDTYRVNASRISILGGDFSGSDVGVRLSDTDDAIIRGARVSDNNLGISVYGTSKRATIEAIALIRSAVWGVAFEAGAELTPGHRVATCEYAGSPGSYGAVSASMAAIEDCP